MTVTLILLALVLVGCRVLIPRLGDSAAGGHVESDGLQRLSDCPDTPNCQGSQSSRPEQQLAPLSITGTADGAINRIADTLVPHSSVAVVTQDEQYLHLTYTTKLMGYVDDVEFLLDEPGNAVHVRSASRLGLSDLGANAKRIAQIRAVLKDIL